MSIEIGDIVKVHGLQRAAHLNNLHGEVISKENDDRYGVKFFGNVHANAKVRSRNLEVMTYPYSLQEGSLVRGWDFAEEDEHLTYRLGEIVSRLGGDDFMVRFNWGLLGEECVQRENLRPFSQEILASPGEPLIEGDRDGLLEAIRTTRLGEIQYCHEAGEQCYEFSYKQAPENFMARMMRNDEKGPPGAAPFPPEVKQQQQMFARMNMDISGQLNMALDEFASGMPAFLEQLNNAKRHVVWVQLDPIGHHCVFERLAGLQGWRFYQSYVMTEVDEQEYFLGHNHGNDEGKKLPGNQAPCSELFSPVERNRCNGYSLLQWVSKDPNNYLVPPMAGVDHPHKNWGQGKVLPVEEIQKIGKLCFTLEQTANDIIDAMLVSEGVGPVPTNENHVYAWAALAKKVVETAKEYHDDGNCRGELTRHMKTDDLLIDIEPFDQIVVPGELADKFDDAFCRLTGELPGFMIYLKMLMFSMYKWTRTEKDHRRQGFSFRVTESSWEDIGFDDDDYPKPNYVKLQDDAHAEMQRLLAGA